MIRHTIILLAGAAAFTLLAAAAQANAQSQNRTGENPAPPAPASQPLNTSNSAPSPAKVETQTPSSATPLTTPKAKTSSTTATAPTTPAPNGAPRQATDKPGKTTTTASAKADVLISVNESTQHMRVSVNGRTHYDFPVSTGRPGYNTPDGRFKPEWMAAMHYSKKYENAPMPHSIFFVNGDAIHGFTDTPFGVAAVSHGCVRLPLADAAKLFNLVKEKGMANTTIYVHGHIPNRPMVVQKQPQPEYPGRRYRYYGDWRYRRYSDDEFPPPSFPFFFRPFFDRPDYGGQAYYRPHYYGRLY
jgi:lipoprotein-anchoring transpeptidase ErfK/SrfK